MAQPRVIACDESGFEGEKLVGGVTADFAHAAVAIGSAEAAECVAELRRRIRSPALEYKANHLLREKNRAALLWFLDPDGPVAGRASLQLVDKADWLVRAIAGAVEPALPARSRADFLAAANEALRSGGSTARLRLARSGGFAPLDLLGPAIVGAVVRWSADGTPVAVVHDRQTALTAEHLAAVARAAGPSLAGLSFTDSRLDARVQVADFLAGVVRRVAADRRAGRVDARVSELLLPYLGWTAWPSPWIER